MTGNHHTIIFVPHARARFRQFRVSSRLLYGVLGATVLSLLLGISFAVLWFRGHQRSREASALAAENRDLRGKTQALNAKLEVLEKQLGEFEERTRKLAIVAGLSNVHDPGTAGVGGLTSLPADLTASSEFSLSDALRRGATVSDRLASVETRLEKQADQLSLTPTLAPVMGVLTSGYGGRRDPFSGEGDFHTGVDISTSPGQPVISPAAGTVVKVGWENGYGKTVLVAHGYGVHTLYGHLAAAKVTEGQRVKRGDILALVGSTGRSTGPHLHYEVQVNNKPVDPLDYILNAF
ncbi:MAG: peptidoglycan DD-metalloendopeptidase family protein [Thermoanaerobaculia bacterium]|nr:hypothetical protein [Thermoanaerobaculia bacterium]MCK6683276.1 peptidoglycan DD-metalloendopeptidase family protein [Thermoanaerobaculia bacterium]